MWPWVSWIISIFDSLSGNYPSIPDRWGEQDRLDDESIKYIQWFKELLLQIAPQLLDQLNRALIPAAREVKKIEREIASLEQNKAELLPKIADGKNRVKRNSKKMQQLEGKSFWNLLFPIGLSIMLVLGLSQIVGIDISYVRPEEYPLFAVTLGGAVFINIAENKSIALHVKYSHAKQQGKANIPFWEMIRYGHPSFYLAVIITIAEICLATPGVVHLLPPSLSQQLRWKLVASFGTGLAALVNVTLAWGEALPKFEQKEAKLKIIDEIEEENHQIHSQMLVVKNLDQQIKQKKRILSDRTARANHEHKRWEFSVKHCLRCHRKTVTKSYERYQKVRLMETGTSQFGQHNGNGKALKNGAVKKGL